MKSTFTSSLFLVILLLVFIAVTPAFNQVQMPHTKKSSRNVLTKKLGNTLTLNIKDFGAKGDGITNDIPAFDAARQVLQTRGGGTIYFPTGKYMSDKNGWRILCRNITLCGDGIDKTYLLTPDHSNAPGIQMAPYRDAGWNNLPEQQITYQNDAKKGNTFIHLKSGQDISNLVPGTIFFISAGASYYDQYYGEFNIVKKINNDTIYLQYQLGRDYTTECSAWYGVLTKPFIPPPAGETAIAYMKNPPKKGNRLTVSLSNDLYEVIKSDSDRVELKNLGKDNVKSFFQTGTKVYKGRSIRITPSAAYNIQVQDMTIEGHRKALIVSNSVKTHFDNIKFIYHAGLTNDGIWLDGDDGRDCVIENCIAQSDSIVGSQFARSFSDIKIFHSVFMQTSVNFTEFNTNCEIANCMFSIKIPDGINISPNSTVITVGASTTDTYIHDNTIHAYRVTAAISAQPDIQIYPRNHMYNTMVYHNIIDAEKCRSSIAITATGDIQILNNTLTGSVSSIFGSSGASLYTDSALSDTVRDIMIKKSICHIANNTFTGYTDGFFWRDPNHAVIEGNTVKRLGDYTSGGNKQVILNGNIIAKSNQPDTTQNYLFTFKNNTFENWNYTENSINFHKPVTTDININNNRFLNNAGTFKPEKDFTISITK